MTPDNFYRQLGGFSLLSNKINRQLKDLYGEALPLVSNASSEELTIFSNELDSISALLYPISIKIARLKLRMQDSEIINQSEWEIPGVQAQSHDSANTPLKLVESAPSGCSSNA